MGDELDFPKSPKGTARPGASAGDLMVPLGELSALLRKLLAETPRKEWYRIKAVRASYEETVDLVLILNALDYLLKVSPDKALRRVMDGQVEEGAFYAAYRGIRDQIRALREKCMTLGEVAGVKVKAWSDGRGRKRRGPRGTAAGAPVPLAEKARKAS